jgi:hypothetical protein
MTVEPRVTDAIHTYPEPGPADAGIGPRFEWFPFKTDSASPRYKCRSETLATIRHENGDVVLECLPIKVDDQSGLTERTGAHRPDARHS